MVVLALRTLRQKDHKFNASLCYIVIPYERKEWGGEPGASG
jgi:hypothetical protein